MKLAIGIFKNNSGVEIQAAYHNGLKAKVFVVNKRSLSDLWQAAKRSISDSVSDIVCSLMVNKASGMVAAL